MTCRSLFMGISLAIFIGIVLIFNLVCIVQSSCNEAVCASIVSKCMLTQSCKCDAKNCTCCRDCFNCLDDLYYECCACVEICPKANGSVVPLTENSHVGDLPDPVLGLFKALTEEKDPKDRWVAYTYPIHQDIVIYTPDQEKQLKIIAVSSSSTSQDISHLEEEQVNCTVAFMTECMPWNKCKMRCASMGAFRFRWFHDGCCECIGDTCLNYGINVNKCSKCPLDVDDFDDPRDDDRDIESNETGEGNLHPDTMDDLPYTDTKKIEKKEG